MHIFPHFVIRLKSGFYTLSLIFVIKAVFHFSRIVAKRSASHCKLFDDYSSRTNDINTIEYATFRYDTVEVENGLKSF